MDRQAFSPSPKDDAPEWALVERPQTSGGRIALVVLANRALETDVWRLKKTRPSALTRV
jgi:hypothetical protein